MLSLHAILSRGRKPILNPEKPGLLGRSMAKNIRVQYQKFKQNGAVTEMNSGNDCNTMELKLLSNNFQ
jgi:hypothetical protein